MKMSLIAAARTIELSAVYFLKKEKKNLCKNRHKNTMDGLEC